MLTRFAKKTDRDWINSNIPCMMASPAHANAGRYATLIAEGRFEEAYRFARDPNPLASIGRRVCGATWYLGAMTVGTFMILVITGVLLMLYHHPSVPQAYADTKDLQYVESSGVFLRNLRRWSVHAMVFLVFAHKFYIFASKIAVQILFNRLLLQSNDISLVAQLSLFSNSLRESATAHEKHLF